MISKNWWTSVASKMATLGRIGQKMAELQGLKVVKFVWGKWIFHFSTCRIENLEKLIPPILMIFNPLQIRKKNFPKGAKKIQIQSL